MNTDFLSRTELLLGSDGLARLNSAHIAVFGLGGVGGAAAEALIRAGVGELTLVDPDTVSDTNRNRQLLATVDTVGRPKVEVAAERFKTISPECRLNPVPLFFLPENAAEFDFSRFDYVLDCVDTVSAKLALAEACEKAGTPLLSCMGTGGKLHPEQLSVAWLKDTSVCPLAKVMRREIKARGLKDIKVVYSKELPSEHVLTDEATGRHIPGSVSFVPPVAGYLMAGEAIREIAQMN